MRSERGWLVLVAAVETVVAVGAAVRTGNCLSGFLVLGPLLAARRLTARVTAAFAAAAVCGAALLEVPGSAAAAPPLNHPAQGAAHVLLVAACGLWAVLTARERRAAEASSARLAHILELAQRALLRPLPEVIGGLALASRSRSATEGVLLGGDVHDAVITASGPRLVLGDVKGHGVDAVQVGAAVLGAFRQSAAVEPDLVRLALTLDARISAELGEEDFVTLLLADFTPGEVRLVNCGHPAPLRTGLRLEALEPPSASPPLGLSPEPRLQRVTLASHQRLLMYTDGLTEARDLQGTLFPLDHRVQSALSAPTLDQALTDLLDLLHRFTPDALTDDLTLLLAQPSAQAQPTQPAPPAQLPHPSQLPYPAVEYEQQEPSP